MNRNSRSASLGALAAVLFSSGCMVGPNYRRPTVATPTAFKEPPPAGWKEAAPNDGAMRGKWWEMYNDPQLNALEEQVSISNQNVMAADARFRQAKAAVRIARAGLFPTVSTVPAITGSQSPANFTTNGQLSNGGGARGLYALPFDASYTADVWGSVRRNIASNSALAQASAADLESARLLYQAELAQDYFALHGLDADQQLLSDAVKQYDEYLTLTQNRYAGGVASLGDVAQARTQLETTRAQLVDVGVQRSQFEHAIAVLTGRPPSTLTIELALTNVPPPAVPLAVPAALLERRPDIAGAERRVASANEQIGIATAAFYPTISIGASAGFQSSSFVDWFNWPSHFWSVGPQLAETLFDAGRRRAVVYQTQAAYDATVSEYRQTVLTAFQQVEDNLVALRVLAQEADVEAVAVQAAQQSLTISTAQYKGGVVSYLQVITAQTVALQDQRTANDILTRRLTASVGLVQALGGGWNTAELPSTRDVLAR